MRNVPCRPAAVVLLALVVSLIGVVTPTTASAAESIPDLQWPAVTVPFLQERAVVSPTGSVTLPCNDSDLTTYDSSGQVIQQIPHTDIIDGVSNCIRFPVVDKNGDVYGIPVDANNTTFGPNLLAYSGNALKWKYPAGCSTNASFTVGANGNIYLLDGDHLVGLAPELQAGQTQPTKVLDVGNLSHSCTKLVSYKQGLVVMGSSASAYYSYSGKFLGQTDVAGGQIDDEGNLFVMTGDGGSSPRVTKYDARTHTESWNYTFSSGAWVGGRMRPLPGGGVIAVTQQGSAHTLVVINNQGQYVRSLAVPSETGDDEVSSTALLVDGNEKAVVLQDVSTTDGTNALRFRAYDIQSNDWTYTATMKGDPSKVGGPSFFYWQQDTGSGVLADDTLFIMATCTGNCGSPYVTRLYPVKLTGVGMEYPRGSVLAANTQAQPAPVPYVALGDSYSSGEGVEPFEDGTDTSTNTCHRSKKAYARLLSQDPWMSLSLGNGGFVACSGAKTEHVATTSFNGEDPQKNAINGNTKLVTMTISGNDVPFRDFAEACAQPFLGQLCNETPYDDAIAGISNNVIPGVQAMLAQLQARLGAVGSDATVLVVGYPQLVPATWASGASGCGWLQPDETPAIREVVSTLNTAIKNEVDAMGGNFHFVPATASGSPFIGHELCRSPSDAAPTYFNNVVLGGPDVYTFHPNEQGQRAYADLVKAYLAQHPLS